MRLPSHFLQIIHKRFNDQRKCLFEQLRFKHRPSKTLEEVSGKKSECLEPCNLPKKSIWNIFGRSKKKQLKCLEKEKKPVKECETVEFVTEEQAASDMKQISEMGGQVYRTCGTAYLLQQEHFQQPVEIKQGSEDKMLEDMMKDPTLKGQCDPMPPFESVGMKLIQLNELKLHPLYKKLMSIPKKPKPTRSYGSSTAAAQYKTRSGPVMPEEFPPHLNINKEILEKKNILFEFKKAEPPQQMLARMVEMKNNEKPQLKKPSSKDCSKK